MKKIKKIGAVLFISSYLLIGFSLASSVVAADQVNFKPQETIPGSSFQQGTGVSISEPIGPNIVSDLLGRYIAAVYNWGLSIVGAIGVLMLMIAGVIWITSGGDTGKITAAKKMIGGSLGGMALLIGAWFLLNTINPNLTKLPALKIDNVSRMAVDSDDGIIDNEKNLPSDTIIKWECMNAYGQTCEDTNPPSITIDRNICLKKLGSQENCTGLGLSYCCGLSASSKKKLDDFCKGKNTGMECKITQTSFSGSGYCENNKCVVCKTIGQSCSGPLKNYECVGASGYCGEATDGKSDGTSDCNCNIFGGNCTCDKTWK